MLLTTLSSGNDPHFATHVASVLGAFHSSFSEWKLPSVSGTCSTTANKKLYKREEKIEAYVSGLKTKLLFMTFKDLNVGGPEYLKDHLPLGEFKPAFWASLRAAS